VDHLAVLDTDTLDEEVGESDTLAESATNALDGEGGIADDRTSEAEALEALDGSDFD
jgi:hypothetical protein